MTQREIARLACRILAIYACLQALPGISYVLGLIGPLVSELPWSTSDVMDQFIWALQPISLFLAAIVLWRWSGLAAAWIVHHDLHDRVDEPDAVPVAARAEQIHAIAFSTVGVWVLVDAMPRAVGYFAQIMQVRLSASGREGSYLVQTAVWFEMIARIGLGIWLVFGSPGIVGMLKKFRYAGLQANERPPAAQ